MVQKLKDDYNTSFLFIFSILVVVCSWLLVDLWGRFVNNLCFTTLGLDDKSAYDTFVIAMTVTTMLMICIFYLKTIGFRYEEDIMEAHIEETDEEGEYSVNIGDYISTIVMMKDIEIVGAI